MDRNRPHHAPVPPPQICYDGEHSREPAHGVTRSETERLYDYWGKADPDALPSKHLLVYHLLDVSAVGSVLLERHPSLLRRFAGMMELDEDLARRWLLWLLAHHDIGKFAAAFQRLKPELFPEKLSDRYRYTVRHDTLGYLLWREKLFAEVFPWVEALSPLEDAILAFLRASSGHHGKPPEEGEWRSSWFRGVDVEAAVAFSRRISDLFFSHERPPVIEAAGECSFASAVSRASWAIAGFAVLCDWIGSNRLRFPFQEEPMDLHVLEQQDAATGGAGGGRGRRAPGPSAEANQLLGIVPGASRGDRRAARGGHRPTGTRSAALRDRGSHRLGQDRGGPDAGRPAPGRGLRGGHLRCPSHHGHRRRHVLQGRCRLPPTVRPGNFSVARAGALPVR